MFPETLVTSDLSSACNSATGRQPHDIRVYNRYPRSRTQSPPVRLVPRRTLRCGSAGGGLVRLFLPDTRRLLWFSLYRHPKNGASKDRGSAACVRCVLHPLPLPLSSCLGGIPPLIGLPFLRFYAVVSSLFLLFVFSIFFCLSRRCPLLATFLFVLFCLLSLLISERFPGLISFGSVYLVTTAGFVADQLM